MKHVYMSEEVARQAFAEKAARHFKANPQHWTYSDGDVCSGEWFAARWGMGNDCVLVFKIGDEDPIIYGGLVGSVEDTP